MEKEPIRFIGGPNDGQSVTPKEPIVPGMVMLGPANHGYTLKQFEVPNPKTGESEKITFYVSDALGPGEAERLIQKILPFRT
ncbi:hypothetical protein [Bordetella petrii]|uniref:hypothetical protein n=1 Tax=Bordetella petrii TaxID=94624 RepID=UPI00372E8665